MRPTIELRFFGDLGTALGVRTRDITASQPTTVAEVWRVAIADHPELAGRRLSLRAAVNATFVPWDAQVAAGDTVAFLPPVSGG